MATQIDVDSEGNEYPLSLSSDAEADQIIELINGGTAKLDQVNGEIVPGYFSNKLDKVISTKNGIAAAIEDAEVEIPEHTPFAAYPALITQIAENIRQPIRAGLDAINGEVIGPDIGAKLEAVENTKAGIAAAIEAKGVEIPANLIFASYENLIEQIQGGPELTEAAHEHANQLLNILEEDIEE
jgi:hypothetical protein